MKSTQLLRLRLYNQGLSQPGRQSPAEVVSWLGAVQSQDYYGALWALAQRLSKPASEAALDQAFAEGALLRTHIMRPTWHFVTPADIRWMLALTGPRTHATNAYYYRQLELDDALFARAHKLLAQALQGGRYQTRPELAEMLAQAGIVADGPRLAYILMHAELEALICSGPRRGKQFTYALLEERATAATLPHDQALAELTRRYFTSHGPATIQDMVWWSGLTAADIRRGLELLGQQLVEERVDGQRFWFAPSTLPAASDSGPLAYLLPNYDEYTVAYKERDALLEALRSRQIVPNKSAPLSHSLVLDGQYVGSWQRTLGKRTVSITLRPDILLTDAERQAVELAAQRYAEFLGLALAFSV